MVGGLLQNFTWNLLLLYLFAVVKIVISKICVMTVLVFSLPILFPSPNKALSLNGSIISQPKAAPAYPEFANTTTEESSEILLGPSAPSDILPSFHFPLFTKLQVNVKEVAFNLNFI